MRIHTGRGRWRFAEEGDIAELTRFLRDREHACVSFTAQLAIDGKLALPAKLRERVAIYEDGDGALRAAILQASTGFVLPVFDDSFDAVPRSNSRALMPLRLPPLLFGAVMGRSRDVSLFRSIVAASPRDEMVYHLMWRPARPVATRDTHPDLLSVRKAELQDFDLLFPLQEAYEKEEVLLPGRRLNPRIVEHNLRNALKQQLVLIGENSEEAIAKVATNARGLGFDQIGGVFTRPEYRNRGIAGHLMRHLIHAVAADGRATTLFVKKHNKPAVAMYSDLDYRKAGDFSIIYYR